MITQRRIAEMLGISAATVSRALDGSPVVAEETRERVLALAKQMGYAPAAGARALRLRGADVLGMIANSSAFPERFFQNQIFQGVADVAASRGLSVSLSRMSESVPNLALQHQAMQMDHRVAGIIYFSNRLDEAEIEFLQSLEDPPIIASGYPELPEETWEGLDCVGVDNYIGMHRVVEALLELGHQKFAFVMGPMHYRDCRVRLRGVQDAMKKAGIDFGPDQILETSYSRQQGIEAVARIIAMREMPTAIVCSNDDLAICVIEGLALNGYRVPADFSVTGVDNERNASLYNPPLSTLDLQPRAVGEQAANLVAQELERQAPSPGPRQILLSSDVILRASTGPPKRGRRRVRSFSSPRAVVEGIENEVVRLKYFLDELTHYEQRRTTQDIHLMGELESEDYSVSLTEGERGESLSDLLAHTPQWTATEGPLTVLLVPENLIGTGRYRQGCLALCRAIRQGTVPQDNWDVVIQTKHSNRYLLRRLVFLRDEEGQTEMIIAQSPGASDDKPLRLRPDEVYFHSVVLGYMGTDLLAGSRIRPTGKKSRHTAAGED